MTAPLRANGQLVTHVERSCITKNRYPDIFVAIAMGINQAEMNKVALYTYRCPICNGWHLTKSKYGTNGTPVTPCTLKAFGASHAR